VRTLRTRETGLAVKHILIDVPVPDDAVQGWRNISGLTVEVLPAAHKFRPLPPEQLRGVHIHLTKMPPVNFEDLTSLEFLQLATVGYEHLRHLNLAGRPFAICNARGVFDTAIAEWVLAMAINLARDVRGSIRNQEICRWNKALRFTGEIRGATLGVWGYGGIGRETARLAKAFGMIVHALTRNPIGPRGDNYAPAGTGDREGTFPDRRFTAGMEREFLSGLDFLVLALPRTRQTDGMVGEDELRALPRTAFVLNPARGAIIQEQALLKALRGKWIAGAALDTHPIEPLPVDSPIWKFPNVIVTPHVSGSDRALQFPARIADLFAQNVSRFLAGQPLLNRLTELELSEA
jgi:phosphoglycerate dehydrogenase-like enzyme